MTTRQINYNDKNSVITTNWVICVYFNIVMCYKLTFVLLLSRPIEKNNRSVQTAFCLNAVCFSNYTIHFVTCNIFYEKLSAFQNIRFISVNVSEFFESIFTNCNGAYKQVAMNGLKIFFFITVLPSINQINSTYMDFFGCFFGSLNHYIFYGSIFVITFSF